MEAVINTIARTPQEYRHWWAENTDVPYGFCWCGCGEKTNLAPQNKPWSGWVKGEPQRYSGPGHHTRKSPVEYMVEDRGYKTPCWVWQRATSQKGYGYIRLNGILQLAHRVYYQRVYGPIPDELQLDHVCAPSGGPRSCVRPNHLETVTSAINQRRGRNAKLSPEGAQDIRALYATGIYSFRSLALAYGVVNTTIRNVVIGDSWQ